MTTQGKRNKEMKKKKFYREISNYKEAMSSILKDYL